VHITGSRSPWGGRDQGVGYSGSSCDALGGTTLVHHLCDAEEKRMQAHHRHLYKGREGPRQRERGCQSKDTPSNGH